MRPEEIQISLRILAVWPQSSLGACWRAKDTKFLNADNTDDDQADLSLRWEHMTDGTYSHVAIQMRVIIKKTRLFKYIENFTSKNLKIFRWKPLKFFHISAQNINCGYSLEPPHRGGSNEYPQSMFLSRNKKNNV